MGKKGIPKVRLGFKDTLDKTPRVQRPTANYDESPSWRFGLLEMVAPYGWHIVDAAKLIEIRNKLADLESMTWHDILVKAADRNHPITIDKICDPAKDRLNALGLDDIDHLISLHLSGKERVWGILELGTLRLLFWDPEHEICPSKKKHT